MLLTYLIQMKMERDHRGPEFPIKLVNLADYIKQIAGEDITIDMVRKAYVSLPMCGTNSGLYFPASPDDKKRQRRINRLKIVAYVRKNRMLDEYHIPAEPVQGRLF